MYQVVYDGTFDGFLTVYAHYREGLEIESIVNKRINPTYQPSIFSMEIEADDSKAVQTINIIKSKCAELFQKVYFAYLCDSFNIELTIFRYIDLEGGWEDLRNDIVIEIEKRIHNLFSERHKLFGFLRFSELEDGTFVAFISPKNNLLPIIGGHFRKRFGNQKWIIVDKIRKNLLFYDGNSLTFGELEGMDELRYSDKEMLIRQSWKKFFDSIAIKERISYERQRNKVPLWVRENMVEFDQSS